MKKNSYKARYLLYPMVLLVMVFATFEYANIQVLGNSVQCCTYGVDCNTSITKDGGNDLRCCYPGSGEQFCSAGKHNYCRASC